MGINDAAIILAGGFGTRLGHMLNDAPKPMARKWKTFSKIYY